MLMETPMPKTKPKPIVCSICHLPIPDKMGWRHGNNAEPVNEGRCCDDCNSLVVIPARLVNAMKRSRV